MEDIDRQNLSLFVDPVRQFPSSKSSIRSGAAGRPDRKQGVHYPKGSQLLEIMPPLGSRASRFSEEISSSTSLGAAGAGGSAHGSVGGGGNGHGGAGEEGSAHGAGEGGGKGNGHEKGRLGSLRDEAAFDLEILEDDLTPLSATLQTRLDFSVVFGTYQAKYENDDFPDEPDVPNQGQKQTKEQKKRTKAPELPITLFAFRLVLIEKSASGLGTIAFLWATVVILGGFASTVGITDFWVVTVIILAETSRIFSRSHELEWQHLTSKSSGILDLGRILSRWTRSFSAQSSIAESKHGRSSLQTQRNVRRTTSAPSRFFGNRSPKSSQSPESDQRTPTNSSSTSSRHNRGQAVEVLPNSAPEFSLPPPRALEPQKRTWSYLTVPLVTFPSSVLTTKLVSRVLYYAQIVSAAVSIGLSVWRLVDQDFYPTSNPPDNTTNVVVSMNIFYVLASLEAGLFLFEKAYWEYMIRLRKILDRVCEEDYVGRENAELVEQFFYDVYGESLKKSVFDGLDMDLVQYSISWLQKEVYKQQLGGARLLNRFVSKNDKFRAQDRFAAEALRTLATTPGIIERLVEMLSWGSRHEEELLREVSTIICRLVVYNRNCARFVAVPGAMEGVVSLLLPHGSISSAPLLRSRNPSTSAYILRLIGLRILKYLCKDHKNSLKIGETRGLLSILMVFIEVRGMSSFKTHDDLDVAALRCHLKIYKKTLQVLLLLASATNTSGGTLRKRIAKIVSGLKNLRDMIEFGSDHPELQRLAIEVIYHLAMEAGMEDDVRKMIGATGGLIRILFDLYKDYRMVEAPIEGNESSKAKKIREEKKVAAVKAGETLTRLVLQNEKNCKRLLELKDDQSKEKVLVPVMVKALCERDEKIASSAASILRSVVKYADDDSKSEIATKSIPLVVRHIFGKGPPTKSEMYEACLGLASRAVQPLDSSKYWEIFNTVNKTEFVKQLSKNLQHTPTTNKYPKIRRFSVELIIALIEKDDAFLNTFKKHNLNLKSLLEKTLDSISEVENFCLFSGLVGYTRHYEEIEDLVERAIVAVDNYQKRSTSSAEIGQ